MVGGGPLAGTRVVDLTRFVAGSYTTMLLAGLGAEVLKIEVPPDGDPYRSQGSATVGDESAIFLALNNGKKSVALDFRHEEGRRALDRLLASADFFVENSRPGSLARHGLDYETLHERFPRLVYGSISGFGETGPDATRGGFDLILQAESGIMSITGDETAGPVKVGAPLLDVGAALSCGLGLLAALVERGATGVGRRVSSSLYEYSLAGQTTLVADHLASGRVPGLLGSHSPTFAPYGVFDTADGRIALAGAGSEDLWRRLCGVLGLEGLVEDPRFATNDARVRHRDELTAEVEAVLRTATSDEWLERLAEEGVPSGRVRDVAEVLASAQVAALGSLQTLEHPLAGGYRTVGPPLRWEGETIPYPSASPPLGAHTREALESAGMSAEEIAGLEDAGVAQVAR